MLTTPSRLAGGLAAGALALGTTLVGGAAPAVSAFDGDSPLMIWAPAKVTAYSYGGEVYGDFGVRLIAPNAPFEVHTHRPDDFDGPITAEWRSGDGPFQPLDVEIPDFSGLPGLVELTVTRVSDGKQKPTVVLDTCLNTWESHRVRPDAPAHSPYPYECPYNRYTLGSVMGIQTGHAVHAVPEWGVGMRLKPGKYDLTASIAEQYVEAFGILEEEASVTTRLRVREESDEHGGHDRRTGERPLRGNAERPSGAAPTLAPGDPLPDLRSLPAWNISLNRKGTLLRFAATVWNAGNSPLVIDGFRNEEDPDHLDTYQYFFDERGNQVSWTEQPVGVMHWHAENHDHWHFEDFAQYALYPTDAEGEMIPGEPVMSGKQSFCLANTDAVDYTVDGADWRPGGTDLGSVCQGYGALSVRQVLSAGSGDTYAQYRHGQAIDVSEVPNGVYFLGVEANPELNLVESDYENNDWYRQVTLKGRGKDRRVIVAPVGVIEEDRWRASHH